VSRKRAIVGIASVTAAVLVYSQSGAGQNAASEMLQQFQAIIEFAGSAALLVLEKSDFQGFTAGVVRRLMFIGGFYALLQFGPTWIPAIIDSFEIIGRRAANSGPLAPSDVFGRGLAAGRVYSLPAPPALPEELGERGESTLRTLMLSTR
jgi:hypothetical protein